SYGGGTMSPYVLNALRVGDMASCSEATAVLEGAIEGGPPSPPSYEGEIRFAIFKGLIFGGSSGYMAVAVGEKFVPFMSEEP
ncbi:hypothetical protein KUA11_17105, partial [Acetobacter estunensis]